MKHWDIVILEDDEDLGEMIRMILAIHNYRILHYTNAKECMAAIAELKPRMMIMDMLLSGADGRLLCRDLKNNPTTRNIGIILMSAHPDAAQGCLQAGADAFVQKPFDIDELRRQVHILFTSL
ncbi:MAG: hypothetical protein RL172_1664 [Bacteroidota bacterium]|jgi:DNA-binding response OmpR family regulator